MRLIVPLLSSVLLVVACGPREVAVPQDPPARAKPPAAVELDQPPSLAVNPTPPQPPLTADGWGDLKIGMTQAQAEEATGGLTPLDGPPDYPNCQMRRLLAPPDTWIMIEKGVVTRVTIEGSSPLLTGKGLGIGATAEAVRAAYPKGAISESPHKYSPPPAKDMFVWTTPGQRGVRYEIGTRGTVEQIHVGGPSIQYVEDCS